MHFHVQFIISTSIVAAKKYYESRVRVIKGVSAGDQKKKCVVSQENEGMCHLLQYTCYKFLWFV